MLTRISQGLRHLLCAARLLDLVQDFYFLWNRRGIFRNRCLSRGLDERGYIPVNDHSRQLRMEGKHVSTMTANGIVDEPFSRVGVKVIQPFNRLNADRKFIIVGDCE